MIKDFCGIFAVSSKKKEYRASYDIYNGLIALQHRGQESAGIALAHGGRLRVEKGMGLVTNVIAEEKLGEMLGSAGIGHVRYSTTGGSVPQNAQPFFMDIEGAEMAIAFNGNIANYYQLKAKLQRDGATFTTTTDTELIGKLFAHSYRKTRDYYAAAEHLTNELDGAYNLAFLFSNGDLVVMRDPMGFRPLVEGRLDEGFVFASETCALETIGVTAERDIEPGEVVVVRDGKRESRRIVKKKVSAHCMFEWIYFARSDSVIEGIPVWRVRERLGEILAKLHPVKADIVVPVPDSGRSYATGYAEASGLPLREGLVKNRYVFRTFIMPSQELREKAVKAKLLPVRGIVEGKRVVLCEDSIVRGTTIRKIVRLLKQGGAREVHVRIGCPPIVSPCYMGIDFPTYEELAAANNSIAEIRRLIGADSLGYMTQEGLMEAIGLGRDRLCMACLTGDYPLKGQPTKESKLECC